MNRNEARDKARQLVEKMTLEEKASQLRYDAPAIPRLGVPGYNWWNESLHGVARAGVSTMFPQAIGLGATFDEELLYQVASVIAKEGRAKFNEYRKQEDRSSYKGLTFWAPNINIFRDPRWGRGHETYGEDPYLTGRLGVAYVKGLQGEGETLQAAACAKHFAVHSGPEAFRHEFDAQVSARDLEETYLPAFEMLVKEAKVEAVMGAYNRVNGEPCCGSKTLIQNILRGRWGFEGHFVSDCWAIRDFHEHHMVTNTPAESAAMALNAGCDLNCGNTYLHILNAYTKGLITEEAITEAAVRLYTTRYLLGLFEETEYDLIPFEVIECREHLELAEKAALESMVLLKNDGILPLQVKEGMKIGVIGPNANSRAALIGNYYGTSSEYITILEGIKDYVGEQARVFYSEGCRLVADGNKYREVRRDYFSEAKTVAEHSDVVILCLGLDETLEGEGGDRGNPDASGDKKDLGLPKTQVQLMEIVAATKKPVILCLMAGSAMDLSYANEHFQGIFQAWYPGARGGKAFAKLLFGEVSPSGKLCVTFYDGLEQLPAFEDYSMKSRTYCNMEYMAQYPFGYGLTYGKVVVESASLREDKDTFSMKVKVRNKGKMATDDVVQVYIKPVDSEFGVRNPKLCGFGRVHVAPGEEVITEIPIWSQAFTVVNDQGERITDSDQFDFYVGCSQPDDRSCLLLGKRPICIRY